MQKIQSEVYPDRNKMFNFILGLIIGMVAAKILDSHFHGNSKQMNPAQTEYKVQDLKKVMATPPV